MTLQDLDGPLDIFKNVRWWLDRRQSDYQLIAFECFHCLSTVLALPFAIYLSDGWDIIIYWFALAGGASLINLIYLRFDD